MDLMPKHRRVRTNRGFLPTMTQPNRSSVPTVREIGYFAD